MNLGQAIEALKAGDRVARAGWNGKSMWLALSGDGVRDIPASSFWSPLNAEYAREQGGSAKVLPCITMKTAGGEILMGWLASQTDMLAEDWMRVPTPAEVPIQDPGCANPAETFAEPTNQFVIEERGHDPETIAHYAQTLSEAETTKARLERDTRKEFRIFSRVRDVSERPAPSQLRQ